MTDYRRNRVPGGTFFFTANLLDGGSHLLVTQIDALRDAVRQVRAYPPFRMDAWVVLPDHMHCLWTLPEGDADFPSRWRAIKTAFCKIFARERTPIIGHDQPWRTRHLAAAVLGAYDPQRSGLCHPHGLHAFQSGEERSGRTPGRLAAFLVFVGAWSTGCIRPGGWAAAASHNRPASGGETETRGKPSSTGAGPRRNALRFSALRLLRTEAVGIEFHCRSASVRRKITPDRSGVRGMSD